ncbi:MAG: hypothetical protein IJS50_05770, partial [Desulfovibrio sp.]|nr:hypothetical protein [Desulfovibrio sp.]
MIRKISTKTGGLLLGGGALLTALGFGFMPSAVWQQFRADVAKFREEIAQKVDDATRGTPLFGSGDFLRKSKAPPVEVTHPSTNPGTLAGPVIRGTSGEEGMLLPDGSFRKEGQRVLERVLEDPKLKKGFVEDLAEYLANGFYPEAQGGRFTITLFSVNRYCGARMNTETGGGRSALMSYVFQPTMLRGLYHLYLRTFLENLAEKASLRCSKRELEQFYTELILKLNELALGLKAILQQPDFELQLASYEKLAEACESINAK